LLQRIRGCKELLERGATVVYYAVAMPVDPELLSILVCPETHQPVKPADAALLSKLNARIAAGELKNRQGSAITEPIQEALVREDGKCLYIVSDSIPIMLIDERVDL